MKPITCNIPDSIYMINSPDEIGGVLRKAFECLARF